MTTTGYYTVGDQIFFSKSLALIEATKTNIHPTWHFREDVFSHLDWTKGYAENITEVYHRRARYLREKYDYLVLSFSGGSDSTVTLRSFLDQGLTVDEVLVRWPRKATQPLYTPNGFDTRPENLLSEWDLAIEPALRRLRKEYPKIKITVIDWSDDVNSELKEDDWFSINDHLNPGVFRKYYGLAGTPTETKMIDAGKKTATIWGLDKPQLAYKDGEIYFYFLDKLANTVFVNNTASRTAELFFWSPDCPYVVQAQARALYEYFIMHPEKLYLIDWDKRTTANKSEYNALVRSLIYPLWDQSIFQVGKPTSMAFNEYDSWMFTNLTDHRYYQSWEHGLQNIKAAIDPKYHQYGKNGRFDGWVGFISPFYKLSS